MSSLPFVVPLVVFSTMPSGVCLINNADEAWSFLIAHWAGNETAEWKIALNSCQLADLGLLANKQARANFVTAVRLAGMQVDQSHYNF